MVSNIPHCINNTEYCVESLNSHADFYPKIILNGAVAPFFLMSNCSAGMQHHHIIKFTNKTHTDVPVHELSKCEYGIQEHLNKSLYLKPP